MAVASQLMLLLLMPLVASNGTTISGNGDIFVEATGSLHLSTGPGGTFTINGKPLDAYTCCDRLAALELKLERLISQSVTRTQ